MILCEKCSLDFYDVLVQKISKFEASFENYLLDQQTKSTDNAAGADRGRSPIGRHHRSPIRQNQAQQSANSPERSLISRTEFRIDPQSSMGAAEGAATSESHLDANSRSPDMIATRGAGTPVAMRGVVTPHLSPQLQHHTELPCPAELQPRKVGTTRLPSGVTGGSARDAFCRASGGVCM